MHRLALIAAAAAVLAGCGGGALPRTTARPLAAQADAIAARAAAGDACGARDHARTLRRQTVAAIDAGHVPGELQEPLLSRASELVSELEGRCLPSVAPAPTAPTTTSPATGGGGPAKPKAEPRDKNAGPKERKKAGPKPKKKRHGNRDGERGHGKKGR